MNKFFLKSTDADFQKLIQQTKMIHKNILYITYQVDYIRKKVMALENDQNLQKTVDDFYRKEDDPPEDMADLD